MKATGNPAAGPNAPGVHVQRIVKDPAPFNKVYDPSHPDAVASGPDQGYVRYPNVDHATEMINALQASARFGSSTAVKEGIKSGLGLSILSARAIDTELKAGLLKALKVKGLSMSRNFYLIRNKLRIASPSCKAMLDFLITTAEG